MTRTLWSRIERHAAVRPDAVAITAGDVSITYAQLIHRSTVLSARLAAYGVQPDDRVGVLTGRHEGFVVAALAILRLGAAYVPLDGNHPLERRSFVVADASLATVVTDDTYALPDGVCAIRWDDPSNEVSVSAAVAAGEAAYVIYTSGSTGRPKGVEIAQSSVLALFDAVAVDFGLNETDVWSWFHSACFDFSVWEIWGALTTGARLVVVDAWTRISPIDFAILLEREQVTVLSQTPSAFSMLAATSESDHVVARLLIFGGETLDTRDLRLWLQQHNDCRVVNMYGITETTVHVTACDVTPEIAQVLDRRVGRPIRGWRVRIVDSNRKSVGVGTAGEIAIAGTGLAIGYVNAPALTAACFDHDEHGVRWYFSGDRGRLDEHGCLEYLGRADSQVKIRGHRVELGEIRGVLMEDPRVEAAAVIVADPDNRDLVLQAFLVLNSDAVPDADTVLAEIVDRATAALPEYEMPAGIHLVSTLPLTLNGKVDVTELRRRIPTAEPAAPVQDTVLGVCARTLGVVLEPTTNFFAAGATSMTLANLHTELKAIGLRELRLRDIYLNPTAAALEEGFAAMNEEYTL